MLTESETLPSFAELQLAEPLCEALAKAGYERPTSIQAETIPHLLAGRDVLGQGKTGTGKTAAFALPLLSRLDLSNNKPQVLVLTPTRELALQVAAAFEKYAQCLYNFRCLAVYGGADFGPQLNQLRRGVQVIVGTPGRVMDHMRRETLSLDSLQTLVLDEADEMLQMGFAEDVEWILTQAPKQRQIALFSATLPEPIRRIAQTHLNDPAEITIQTHTATVDTIRQRYMVSQRFQKIDDLDRILEAEPTDGVIIFVKTKSMTVELADELVRRGHAACALNGDMAQGLRERTVEQLRAGRLDVLVATDVAARGLDVQRISHVINYDSPSNSETYIHRIGRTGRAGRSGESILFIDPRGRGLLRSIERATGQTIQPMELPNAETINAMRVVRFREQIQAAT
ncbi:MAG: DEAD/DEAH box helicase, partial [Planctomycetales bacterium]|nr:DEAD/DEAH box helicase [Planctomycetales bacterium]